jgi:hypothetical protein
MTTMFTSFSSGGWSSRWVAGAIAAVLIALTVTGLALLVAAR